MGHHLGEVPHIDQRTADGTFTEMIGLGLCYAVSIAPELHSRTSYSKATPQLKSGKRIDDFRIDLAAA